MYFQVGERVVYPNHGVGIIESVSKAEFSNGPQEFYHLRIQATNSLVMIPIANIQNVGIRRIIRKDDITQLYKLLSKEFKELDNDWKERFRDNSDRMRTGDIFEVAEVVKNLVYLNHQKPLSFREKRLLDRAKQILVCEIATVGHQKPQEVEELIDKALSSAYRRTLKKTGNVTH
jgi:CarD family transcriptional regulator